MPIARVPIARSSTRSTGTEIQIAKSLRRGRWAVREDAGEGFPPHATAPQRSEDIVGAVRKRTVVSNDNLNYHRTPRDPSAADVLRELAHLPAFCSVCQPRQGHSVPFERARHAPIAAADLGRFIAALCADPAPHAGKIYPLRGLIEMNHDEIANAIGEVLGFEVRSVPLEIDEFRLRLERDLQFPPFMVQHLCEVALDYRNGIFGGTDDIIERVTGEAPMTVQAFISHHKDAFSET